MDHVFYIACVLGAAAVWLSMPRRQGSTAAFGALLGAATLGGTWLYLARYLPTDEPSTAMIYQYVFSGLAIVSAVRVITHRQPVFAALWFVMTILAVAGLLLILEAEFMAFALAIIYGGAILVTYVFVIMLASQSVETGRGTVEQPEYDRVAREPVAATLTGFVLLAVLLSIMFQPIRPNPAAADPTDRQLITQDFDRRAVDRLAERLPEGAPAPADIADPTVHNTERVGLDLFRSHPLGLELAGVILVVALIGAVVIARQRLEVPQPTTPQPDATGGSS